MTEVIKTNTHEQQYELHVPAEVRERLLAKLATQPGFINEEEFESALMHGWQYGLSLVNGFKPEVSALRDMTHQIFGTSETAGITTNHHVPVMYILDASAREAKRTLPAMHHDENSGEEIASAV